MGPAANSTPPPVRATSGISSHSHRPAAHIRFLVFVHAPGNRQPMRLGVKLALLLSCASAAPLALATVVTLPSGSRELRSQVVRIHAHAASVLACHVHRVLLDKLDALTLPTP